MPYFDEMHAANAQNKHMAPSGAAGLAAAAFIVLAVAVPFALSVAEPDMELSIRLGIGALFAATAAAVVYRLASGNASAARSDEAQRERDARAAEAAKKIAEIRRKASRAGEGTKEC